jgi:hypothetical protein
MTFDLNDTKTPGERGGLIPDGTIATVRMTIKPGGVGDGNWFTRSQAGGEYLAAEYTILDGNFARRKFWDNHTTSGPTPGHQSMAEETMKVLAAILNSAHNLRPDDNSPEARAKRTNVGPATFDGINFLAKIGIVKGKKKPNTTDEFYQDQNRLAVPITPDRKEWRGPIPQSAPCATPAQTAAAPAAIPTTMQRPGWAT